MTDADDLLRTWAEATDPDRDPVTAAEVRAAGPATGPGAEVDAAVVDRTVVDLEWPSGGRSPQRSGRLGWAVAAALVVVVGAVGVALTRSDTGEVVGATDPPTGDVTFEVLGRQTSAEPPGTLRAATAPDELAELWRTADLGGPVPTVDLDQQVVVSITTTGSSCPPDLVAFARDGTTLEPRFVPSVPPAGPPEAPGPAACLALSVPYTTVVALDRSTTGPQFSVRLPSRLTDGPEDVVLDVDLQRPVATCAEIEAFAERIVDVGVDFDFTPSPSPSALASEADAVVTGVLTGETASARGVRSDGLSDLVGFEVEVTRVVDGSAGLRPGATVVVWMGYSGAHRPAADYEAVAVAGVPVVAFVRERVEAPEGVSTLVPEGLATACAGQPPTGWVGSTEPWRRIGSLEELAAAASA